MHARLFDESNTQILELNSPAPGSGISAVWAAPAAGTYYLEVTPADARIYGQDVLYLVYLGDPHLMYMPVIGR